MADNFKLVQAQKFQLAGSGISLSDTTIILKSFADPYGNLLTTSDFGSIGYGTLEPGTDKQEIISFTTVTQNANGTATLTGVTRGLKFKEPYDQDTALRKSHAGNSVFILTNNPQVYAKFLAKDNDESITGLYSFTQLPTSTAGNATDGDQLITYAQALALATGTAAINRIVVAGNAGETVSAGQLLYLLVADGEWYKADADTAAQVDNVILGIAQGAGTNGNSITNGVLLFGLDSNQTGLTDNTAYYAGNTAGVISSTPGTVEVSVGVSRSTTSILFYPRYNQQLTEDQKDALLGTSGTPSNTNRYVTNDDTTGTGAIQRATALANYGLAKATFTAGASITAGQPLHITPYAQSDGGITFDAATGSSYSNATNQSMSHTVGSGANRFLIVSVTATSVPSSVTYNGTSMTLVDSQASGGTGTLYVYSLVAPASGANNVTVTATGIYGILASSYANCAQTSTISATNKTSGNSSTLTTTTSTVAAGSMVYAVMLGSGLSGTQSGSFTFNTKYKYQQAGLNPVTAQTLAPSSFAADTGIFNEIQNISMVSTWSGSGGGSPFAAQIQVTIAPFSTPAIGVVPTNASVVVNNEPLIDFIGIADSSVSAGASVVVTIGSIASGLSGLTPGKTYYLSNSVGTLSTTPGAYAKAVGYALSSTTLQVSPRKTVTGTGISKTNSVTYTAEADGMLGTATSTYPITRGSTYSFSSGTNFFYPIN